jgi:NADH-ubiquinone oxidoreductase chain 5
MILNRIGDFGLVIGILIIFVEYRAVDYATVFSITPIFVSKLFNFLSFDFDLISIICFFLFVGAIGKSAQSGLHTWLSDAMEGPIPVSALIHAATMVTAGVFLIARTSPLFEYTPNILSLVTIVGACTAFFAATVGLLQNDLKRVIAYSTCSQLGYMVFACGLSNYSVGVFHLINHAFFKALLFLGAGSIIHAVADEQDIRKMGGLKKLAPFTYSMMVIGSLALIGFPFLTGFYSKDVILEVAYGKYTEGHFSYILRNLGAFFTAFYQTRLVYLTFLSVPNGYKPVICSAYDSSYQITISLFLLVISSVLIGFYSKDMIIGFGSDFCKNAIIFAEWVEDFLLSLSNIHSNTAMCEGNPQEGFSPNPNVSRNFVLFENNVAFEVNVRGQVLLFEPRPLSHGVVQQPDGLGNLNNPNVNGAQNPVNNLQQINDAPSANTQ